MRDLQTDGIFTIIIKRDLHENMKIINHFIESFNAFRLYFAVL